MIRHPSKKTAIAILSMLLAVALFTTAMAIRRRSASQTQPERLFFSLKIESRGKLIASPRLLGEAGTMLTMKLVDQAKPDRTRVALELLPSRMDNGDYTVDVGIQLPLLENTPQTARIQLTHGEEKTFLMMQGRVPLTVTLLLMKVDSPEFEALMELVQEEQAAAAT